MKIFKCKVVLSGESNAVITDSKIILLQCKCVIIKGSRQL